MFFHAKLKIINVYAGFVNLSEICIFSFWGKKVNNP